MLFIMLYKLVHIFIQNLKCENSHQRYLAVIFYGSVYYAVQGSTNFFISVIESTKCDRSNESHCNLFMKAILNTILILLAVCLFSTYKPSTSHNPLIRSERRASPRNVSFQFFCGQF